MNVLIKRFFFFWKAKENAIDMYAPNNMWNMKSSLQV